MNPSPSLVTFKPDQSADAWHTRVFRGEIARFQSLNAMLEIVEFARAFVCDALETDKPWDIHRQHPVAHLAELLAKAQRLYNLSSEARRGWRALFEEVGLDTIDTARDRLVLRFQPPTSVLDADAHLSTATLGIHRDTWASNLYAQMNWWGPVFPVAADRTMGLFPNYWELPVSNDSATFDMVGLLARRREQPASIELSDMTPRPDAHVDLGTPVPVIIPPGDVIAFSGQHLHFGIPNSSDKTRISLDTRTIRRSDHTAARGAPNIDGRARWATPMLFRQIAGGSPFHEMIGVDRIVPFEGPYPPRQIEPRRS